MKQYLMQHPDQSWSYSDCCLTLGSITAVYKWNESLNGYTLASGSSPDTPQIITHKSALLILMKARDWDEEFRKTFGRVIEYITEQLQTINWRKP